MNSKKMKEYAITISIALILSIIVRIFVIDTITVEGQSMMNTIEDGDKVVYSKLASPDKGDIVIVESEKEDIVLIKRVIATEGDTIEIKDNQLVLNGKIKEESYIKEEMHFSDFEEIKIGKDEIYVMGDNRNFSSDSRILGPLTIEEYKGEVLFSFNLWNKLKWFK